jgi:hypothetical protein
MRTGMSAVLAHRKEELIREEVKRICNNFATNPNHRHRAITTVTKLILLNAPYICQGSLYDIKVKSLGAGIYELWAELVNK